MATAEQSEGPRYISAAKLREALAYLSQAAAILECAPRALGPGDREVAELLLPAWHAVHGHKLVTVAELRKEPADTELGGVVAAFLARWGDDRSKRGPQAFGELLSRLVGHPVAGYAVRQVPGTSGGVAVWGCSPT